MAQAMFTKSVTQVHFPVAADVWHVLCRAMQPGEKQDLNSFTAAARQRVAQQVNCPVSQVGPFSGLNSRAFLQLLQAHAVVTLLRLE